MPEIEFACPNCNQTLEAPVELAGETVECPSCAQPMVVPQPQPAAGSAADISIGGAATPQVSVADVIAQLATEEPPATAPACSACAAPMAAEAVLCLHCGYHKGLGKKISTEME